MNFMEQLTSMERRLKVLEANRGASLRYCEVTGVDKAGNIRVKLLDGDKMVSQPLRSLQKRTLKDKDQCFPDIGEHVACLFAGQGFESGVILGPMYSDKNQSPNQPIHYDYKQYEDGTVIYYDRKNHKYIAMIKGDIEITCTMSVTVQADGNIMAISKQNITAKAEQMLVLEGNAGVKMRGPSITFEGISGKGCEATINANLSLKGEMKHVGNHTQQGNRTHQGNLSQQGNQAVGGSISASGKITGSPVIGCPH